MWEWGSHSEVRADKRAWHGQKWHSGPHAWSLVSREGWGSGGTPDFDRYFRKVIVSSCGYVWGCDLAGLEGDFWKLWERQWFGSGRWWWRWRAKGVFGSGTNRTCWRGGRRGEEFRVTPRFWHEDMGGWQCLLVRWGRLGAKQILKGQIKPWCGALSLEEEKK